MGDLYWQAAAPMPAGAAARGDSKAPSRSLDDGAPARNGADDEQQDDRPDHGRDEAAPRPRGVLHVSDPVEQPRADEGADDPDDDVADDAPGRRARYEPLGNDPDDQAKQ